MKKTMGQRAAICLSFFVLSAAGAQTARSQAQSSGATTESAPVAYGVSRKNPHLLELEKRLDQVIFAAQPDAEIEFASSDFLGASYRSEKQPALPADSSNFQLYLQVKEDVMYYRANNTARYAPQPFGTTFSNRYNLRVLAPNFHPTPNSWPTEVPREHWAYKEYDSLVKIGLLPDRFPGGFSTGPYVGMMTRYQFALVTARLMDKFPIAAPTANVHPDTKNALTAFQREFAPEMVILGIHLDADKSPINGQIWRPRYQYLSLFFNYGKGVDASLVDKINQTLADYANSILNSTSSACKVSTPK